MQQNFFLESPVFLNVTLISLESALSHIILKLFDLFILALMIAGISVEFESSSIEKSGTFGSSCICFLKRFRQTELSIYCALARNSNTF